MPSTMISNSAQFRPLRWLAVAVLLCAAAFAVGVLYGAAVVSAPPASRPAPVTAAP